MKVQNEATNTVARRTSLRLLLGHGTVIVLVLVIYVIFQAYRLTLAPGLFKDSFPSLIFPLFLFSVASLVPRRLRGYGLYGPATRQIVGGTACAILILEVIAPRFDARIVGEVGDALALACGSALYVLVLAGIRMMAGGQNRTRSNSVSIE